MAKLKDGFYKQTAEAIGSDLHVLLAGGGSKALTDFAYKSDLTGFVTGGPYLPTAGGTITGTLKIYRDAAAINYCSSGGTSHGWLGFSKADTPTVWMANGSTSYDIIHSGNHNDSYHYRAQVTNSSALSFSNSPKGIVYYDHYSGHTLGSYRGVLVANNGSVAFELNSCWCVNPTDAASANDLRFRVKRDAASDWGPYSKILTEHNYSTTLDTRYYTETEVNNLLANYLPLAGGTMESTASIRWKDRGAWGNSNATYPYSYGGLSWNGTSDSVSIFAREDSSDQMNLVIKFGDDTNHKIILSDNGTESYYLNSNGNWKASILDLGGVSISYGDSALRVTTAHGNAYFGMMNGSYCHIYTDGPAFYFNKSVYITGNTVLHGGNYNNFSPTLTGGGASGTWGINISGTAAHATSTSALACNSFDTASQITTAYAQWANNSGCSDVPSMSYAAVLNVGYGNYRWWQIWNSRNDHQLYWRPEKSDASGWADVHILIDNKNIANYLPTVTNYYWADQLITSSAKSNATPTFGNVNIKSGTDAGLAIYTSDAYGRIRFYNSANENKATIHYFATAYSGYTFAKDTLNIGGITTIGAWNNPTMYITQNTNTSDTSGKVGIGTVNPSYKLEVIGGVKASEVILFDNNSANSTPLSYWGIYGWDKRLSFTKRNSSNVYQSEPMTIFYDTGYVGINVVEPSERLHINGNFKIQGTSNTSTKPDIYLGYYTSWNGGTYPTLMSGYTSKWIMHFNPHICKSDSTDMPGSNIRMQSINSNYYDLSVAYDGNNYFRLRYNNNKNLVTVNNSGQINIINGIVMSGSIGAGAGSYLVGNDSTGVYLAANESGKKLYLESTNQSCPYFRNSAGDFPIIHSNNWGSYIGTEGYVMKGYEINATGLNADTWYPVTIPLSSSACTRIEVRVALNYKSKPSWSTHEGGFTVRKVWESNGSGWGTSTITRRVLISSYEWASSDPVREIGQLSNSSTEYFFVRGGGHYYVYTSHGAVPTLRTSTYTVSSQSVGPTTSTPAAIGVDVGHASSAGSATSATYARYVIADNNAQSPGYALLQSGSGRADASPGGDTWIYWDALGGTSSPWGFKHEQADNYISFYGAGARRTYISLSNGCVYAKGFYHLDYGSSAYALTSNGGVAHIGSMSVNYATSAGNADTVDNLHASDIYGYVEPYDLNNVIKSSGIATSYYDYATSASVVNQPGGNNVSDARGVITFGYGYPFQLSWRYNDAGSLYARTKYGSSWNPWIRIATASDIPTVTNYYWANVPISASSNSGTSPTFANITTANILPKASDTYTIGSTGNEYSTGDIRIVYARHLDSARSYTGDSNLYIQYLRKGNTLMQVNGGNVGIGIENPNEKLHVNGNIRITGTNPAMYIRNTSTAADTYSSIRFGNADGDNKAYIFLNGPSRTSDGGQNVMTIRNNVGSLRLDNATSVTGLLTVTSGSTHCGIKVGNNYINAISGELIIQNNTAIRFGDDSWDYDVWAGLRYVSSAKTIHLGIADKSIFSANNALGGGTLNLPGIRHISSELYNIKVGSVAQHTPSTSGWYTVAQVSGYFNYDIYITGGWHNGMPSTVRVNICNINGTSKITQLAGYVGSLCSQIRLGRVSTDVWDVQVYITAQPGTMGEQRCIFTGFGGLTIHHTSTLASTSYSATNTLAFGQISGISLTTDNYASYLDSRYYTETESDDRFVNVTGDTMTGSLTFSTDSSITWSRNTDYASIRFQNTVDGDTNSYLDLQTGDNGDEYIRFSRVSGSTTYEVASFKSDGARINGNIWTSATGTVTANYLDLRGATNATMTYASTNPCIVFSEQGGQCVKLLYTDYDSYRSPAGLKVIGDQGGEWFEVVGTIYGGGFYHNSYGSNAYVLTAGGSAAKIADLSVNYANSAADSNKLGGRPSGQYVWNIQEADFDPSDVVGNYVGMSTKTGLTSNWTHILSFDWRSSGTSKISGGANSSWETQLALPTQNRKSIYYRSFSSTAPYDWVELIDSANILSKAIGYLHVHDVRDASRAPNYFPSYTISGWFNSTGTPSSSWYSGIHVKGWTNGYASWELCSYSSTGTSNDYDLYFRNGNNDKWGSWKTVITSGNIGSQSVNYATSAGSASTATTAGIAGRLGLISCYGTTTNSGLWSAIKTGTNSYLGTATVYEVYNNGGPDTFGEVLDIVSVHGNHWQPQLWFGAGKDGRLRYRNKNYNNNSWGDWKTVAWTSELPSVGNGTVTITQNGVNKGSFTMNQSGNTTIALTDTDTDTDTWRTVQCNGTSIGSNTLNLKAGSNVSLSNSGGTITIAATDTNTNYYPTRSYTSGLQISSYVGSSDCALYVPNATGSQAGVVSTAAQTFAGEKTFSAIRLRSTSTTNYGGYLYFGDSSYAYIAELTDDKLTYKANDHIFNGASILRAAYYIGTVYKPQSTTSISTASGYGISGVTIRQSKPRAGKCTITVTNNSGSGIYLHSPNLSALFIDAGTGSCYEHGFAYIQTGVTFPRSISNGSTFSFSVIYGYMHTQGSWSSSDFTKSNDNGGFTCSLYASVSI